MAESLGQTLQKIVETLQLLTADRKETLQLLTADRKASESSAKSTSQPSDRATALTNVLSLVGKFNYDSRSASVFTFKQWLQRNARVLESHCESDEERQEIVLRALEHSEYHQLCARLSPRVPESVPFDELTAILEKMFGPRQSLFRRRHDTLLLERMSPGRPVDYLVDNANLKGDEFEFESLTLSQFKILILLLSISGPSYLQIRNVIIRALDDRPDIGVDQLRDLLTRYETRTCDALIDTNASALNKEVEVSALSSKTKQLPARKAGPPKTVMSPCLSCGGRHPRKDCKFRKAVCRKCQKEGHIAKVCRSSSALRENLIESNSILSNSEIAEGRVFFDVSVNGHIIHFRADSGADVTVISLATWQRLGSPALEPYSGQCTQADGRVLRIKGYFTASPTVWNQ